MTESHAHCPHVDWHEVDEEGLICCVYTEDAADIVAALAEHWDDLAAAAHAYATATTTDPYFSTESYWNKVCTDSETMEIAYQTRQAHAPADSPWPTDWPSMVRHLVYWVVFDRFWYDLDCSRSNILAALANGTLKELANCGH